MASFFEVSGTVARGVIGIGDVLGYHDGLVNRPLCRRALDGWATISAHATSEIKLKLARAARVFGFINASAKLDRTNPVEFWADYNYVGRGYGPCDATSEFRLEPGEHLLQAICLGSGSEDRHTIWALRETELNIERSDTSQATADNTAVLTVAAYKPAAIRERIAYLAYSARKQDIWLRVQAVGETFDHYRTKIVNLRKWISDLPNRFSHVVFVDCKDVLFARSLGALCDGFNEIGAPIVFSAESICLPIVDTEWRERFPAAPGNRRWLNSGMWMARRAAALSAFDVIIDLSRRLNSPAPDEQLADIWKWRHLPDSDQIFWQICHLKELFPIYPDHDYRLFANIATMDRRLGSSNNNDFILDPVAGSVKLKSNGCQPSVLHFSGTAHAHCMQQWAGYLGLVDS
jgi:hypothetical protein